MPFAYYEQGAMPGFYNNRGGYLPIKDISQFGNIQSDLWTLIAERDVKFFFDFLGP